MEEYNSVRKHADVCSKLNAIYTRKNEAYGNSFSETYKRLGPISAVTRIADKYNRLANLITNPNIDNGDESVKDTLLDMANYCIMTYMEMSKGELPEGFEQS